MDFSSHAFTQRLIDQLMAPNAALAGKFGADHNRFKMLAISCNAKIFGRHALRDALLNTFRGNHCYPV